MAVRLQAEAFVPGAELDGFIARTGHDAGAVASFTGLVRSLPGDGLIAMTLEHYPALAQRQLETLEREARTRFDLAGSEIIHRFGRLLVGEPIVFVLAAASHRQAAFDAASFMMDTLKTSAPFWKKEERADGTTGWVSARDSDDAAAARWAP